MSGAQRRADRASGDRARGLVAALLGALLPALLGLDVPVRPTGAEEVVRDGTAYARVTADAIALGNEHVERTWSTAPFGTSAIVDRRTGLATGPSPDLRLELHGLEVTGHDLVVTRASARTLPRGGVAVEMVLAPAAGGDALPVATVTRTVSVFPGVAGFETRTVVAAAGALTGYTLDEVTLPGAAPTLHHFSAGYDWRGSDTPDWEPQLAPFGGAHTGDHRETTSAPPGAPLEGRGQWLSLRAAGDPAGRAADARVFLVTQRVNYASTRGAYDGSAGRAAVDLRHDVAYLGPFEADVHLASPAGGAAGRARWLRPDRPLELERVFTGLAVDGDDEPWQHHRYLDGHRAPDWRRDVVFNSNGVDSDRISTGAKDDMDLAEVVRQAEVARRIGVETFVLDDGWQARSGDWCPDSPECPEPRYGSGDPRFAAHRFPDAEFAAVRQVLGDMRLGLWMSPMHFHPSSDAYRSHPEWACTPVGDALAAYNTADPESGSNEAGLGTWNPEAVGRDGRELVEHVEARIQRAIDVYGATYFKFDFLVWLDCLDVEPVDAYTYREAFVALLDRLIARNPDVTFQVDETNDHRLFPFESVARGPSWYANGSPTVDQALHNVWVLSPYVPGYTVGQAALGRDRRRFGVDYVMAAALPSHLTFFDDLTDLEAEGVDLDRVRRWTDLYRRHRDRFATFAYPLLDDPLGGTTWTGLQPWDADAQRGALLVFRQDAPDATRTVALRGVRGEGRYRLYDPATGDTFAVLDGAQLRAGFEVTLPARHSALVLLVDRIGAGRDHPRPHRL